MKPSWCPFPCFVWTSPEEVRRSTVTVTKLHKLVPNSVRGLKIFLPGGNLARLLQCQWVSHGQGSVFWMLSKTAKPNNDGLTSGPYYLKWSRKGKSNVFWDLWDTLCCFLFFFVFKSNAISKTGSKKIMENTAKTCFQMDLCSKEKKSPAYYRHWDDWLPPN